MALPRYVPSYTVDDYTQWEGRWELWSGIPVAMSPSADKRHQKLAGELHHLLKSALKRHGCLDCEVYFELDWRVCNDTVFRPDLLIVYGDTSSRYIEKTPVLVAEILSQSTRQRDLIYKRESYLQLGVLYYVIVDPERESVELLVHDRDCYVPRPDSVLDLHPGCSLQVNWALFP